MLLSRMWIIEFIKIRDISAWNANVQKLAPLSKTFADIIIEILNLFLLFDVQTNSEIDGWIGIIS